MMVLVFIEKHFNHLDLNDFRRVFSGYDVMRYEING